MYNPIVSEYVFSETKKVCEGINVIWESWVATDLLDLLEERHGIHKEQSLNAISKDLINRYVTGWANNQLRDQGIF